MEAIVEFSYSAHEPDELTLRKGDIIKDIKIMAGGWWEGTLRDKRGMFPDNFVKVIEHSPNGQPSKIETKINNGTIKKDESLMRNGSSGRKYCKVLFSYEPCNDDELALLAQDTIEFLEEVEEGWWRGKLHGRVGVFPSNFVTTPTPEEAERPSGSIERATKELCVVLFSYEAQNEDELTINEGEIVTIISRNVADKGWWKGEIHGKVGLFPDNFVDLIGQKNENEEWHESNQSSLSKSSGIKHHLTHKKSEKAHARKRLDLRGGGHTIDNMSSRKISDSATSTMSSTSSSSMSSSHLISPGDLKLLTANTTTTTTTILTQKRTVEKSNDSLTETVDSLTESCINEELDGIERGEGAPLSHLTASRAKAPRRRLPSSQHVRGQIITNNLSSNLTESFIDENLTNGSIDSVDQIRASDEDNNDNAVSKTRRKTAPWMEELKMNQMEKRKTNDKNDKSDIIVVKKERSYPRPPLPELPPKLIHDDYSTGATVELRQKNKDKELNIKTESSHVTCPVSPTTTAVTMPTGTTPAYVPYKLYSQLFERVVALEEKHNVLQRTVAQLTEQLGASSSANKL